MSSSSATIILTKRTSLLGSNFLVQICINVCLIFRTLFSYSFCFKLTGKRNKTSQCFTLKQDYRKSFNCNQKLCLQTFCICACCLQDEDSTKPYSGNLSTVIRPFPESLCNVPSLIVQKRLPYIVLYLNLSQGFKEVVQQ